MGLKIKVAIAALMLCGAMIGCGPSKAELKVQQRTKAIEKIMGTWETKKKDEDSWKVAEKAIDTQASTDCDALRGPVDANGIIIGHVPQEWMDCYAPFFEARKKLEAAGMVEALAAQAFKAKADQSPTPCVSNCSVAASPLVGMLTGCRDGYTTDSAGTMHCNEHPIPVRIVP
jgi:hypothetical protein